MFIVIGRDFSWRAAAPLAVAFAVICTAFAYLRMWIYRSAAARQVDRGRPQKVALTDLQDGIVARISAADLGAMTVNERLFALGLLEPFDRAARRRDRETMIALLAQVDVAPDTADAIISHPRKYGY